MYDEILLPTDGSAGTAEVATHAIDLAERYDARLHALYVIDVAGTALDVSADSLSEAYRREGERATRRIAERAESEGVETTASVERGYPHEEILEYVDEEGIDLVVMGTHGRSGIDRMLLGSVTERVLRLSPVPVVTVRLPEVEDTIAEEEEAVEVARRAAENEGYEVESVGDAYDESGTWIVQLTAGDGTLLNVHVDARTEEARVAELGE